MSSILKKPIFENICVEMCNSKLVIGCRQIDEGLIYYYSGIYTELYEKSSIRVLNSNRTI